MVHKPDRIALEAALHDAFMMADLTTEFLGRAVGFDDLGGGHISSEDQGLVSFAVVQTKVAIKRALHLLHVPEEGGL